MRNLHESTITIGDLVLDGGATLSAVEQRVTMYGTPKGDGTNVVLVPHALTGSSRVADWWPGIVGPGALYDPADRCIIGINVLGGCYGSSGSGARVTVRDMVSAQRRALDLLGIPFIDTVIGGSLGGMQALHWAFDAPERVGRAIVIGAHDHHSAMGIALNAVQRDCLELDPIRGLRTARKVAMLTYKSDDLLRERHDRRPDRNGVARFDIEGYLEAQAYRFESRMDATTYATLTHAMDSFDVRDAAFDAAALPELLFVGISSDWLFRPTDIAIAAERLRARGARARYIEMKSDHGHDAFLADPTALRSLLECEAESAR